MVTYAGRGAVPQITGRFENPCENGLCLKCKNAKAYGAYSAPHCFYADGLMANPHGAYEPKPCISYVFCSSYEPRKGGDAE